MGATESSGGIRVEIGVRLVALKSVLAHAHFATLVPANDLATACIPSSEPVNS